MFSRRGNARGNAREQAAGLGRLRAPPLRKAANRPSPRARVSPSGPLRPATKHPLAPRARVSPFPSRVRAAGTRCCRRSAQDCSAGSSCRIRGRSEPPAPPAAPWAAGIARWPRIAGCSRSGRFGFAGTGRRNGGNPSRPASPPRLPGSARSGPHPCIAGSSIFAAAAVLPSRAGDRRTTRTTRQVRAGSAPPRALSLASFQRSDLAWMPSRSPASRLRRFFNRSSARTLSRLSAR